MDYNGQSPYREQNSNALEDNVYHGGQSTFMWENAVSTLCYHYVLGDSEQMVHTSAFWQMGTFIVSTSLKDDERAMNGRYVLVKKDRRSKKVFQKYEANHKNFRDVENSKNSVFPDVLLGNRAARQYAITVVFVECLQSRLPIVSFPGQANYYWVLGFRNSL